MASPEADRPRGRVSESRRNRAKLITAATDAFAEADADLPVHLEAVARAAGVGIGTLYRHFPTRESLAEAVYHDQIERLRAGTADLLAASPPTEALRTWMSQFLDWAATKHGMGDTLRHVVDSGRIGHSEMRSSLIEIISVFLDAGSTSGDFRPGVDAADVAALLAGVLLVAGGPDQRPQAERMVRIVVDGLRWDSSEPREQHAALERTAESAS